MADTLTHLIMIFSNDVVLLIGRLAASGKSSLVIVCSQK